MQIDGQQHSHYCFVMHRSSRVKTRLRSLRRAMSKCFTYTTCFGVSRGVYFFLHGIIWFPSNVRIVSAAVPNSSTRLRLRLGTTDIEVFNSIYYQQEYGWEFTAPPKVIVDAGAYIGLSTAFFAMRYPDAKIIAIEPNQENFDLLVKNTAKFVNVRTIQAALWAESGSVYITDPGLGSWGFRMNAAEGAGVAGVVNRVAAQRESIRAVTVDDIMREHDISRIDLLKVDIEGSEKEVFASPDSWITNVEAICLELHDRFRAGCSRAFFKAIDEFPIELWRSEDILVLRDRSQLGSLTIPSQMRHDLSATGNRQCSTTAHRD